VNTRVICVVCERSLAQANVLLGSQLCDSAACEFALTDHLRRQLPCCCICGRLVPNPSWHRGTAFICQRIQCQSKSNLIKGSQSTFCQICGIYLENPSARSSENLCQSPICRRMAAINLSSAKTKVHAEALEKRRHDLAEVARQQSYDLQPDLIQASSLKIVVLPYLEYNVTEPSLERLRHVAGNFLSVAREAYALNAESESLSHQSLKPDASVNAPVEQGGNEASNNRHFTKMSEQACGTCGGKCCNWGGDDAFLGVDKFREVLRARPNADPDTVVAEYMAHVPERTFRESCIFHGPLGCGLSRELRSITCNSYLCASLHELSNEIIRPDSRYVLAATNFRNVEDPELNVLRITVASHNDVQTLLSD
jgi:hypothetical protein